MRGYQTGRVGSQQSDQPSQQHRHARTDGRGLQAGIGIGDVARAREGDAAGQIAIVVGIGVRAHGIGQDGRHAQREPQRQQHGEREDGAARREAAFVRDGVHRALTSQSASVR